MTINNHDIVTHSSPEEMVGYLDLLSEGLSGIVSRLKNETLITLYEMALNDKEDNEEAKLFEKDIRLCSKGTISALVVVNHMRNLIAKEHGIDGKNIHKNSSFIASQMIRDLYG